MSSWPRTELARGIVAAPIIAGIVGITSLPLILILRRPSSAAVKVAAYGCPVFAGFTPVPHYFGQRKTDNGHEANRRQRLVKWLSDPGNYLEPNEAQVLGAAAGLLAASRCRVPGLRRWHLLLGLTSIGAGTGEIGKRAVHWARRSGCMRDEHDTREQCEDSMMAFMADLHEVDNRRDSDSVAQKMLTGPSPTQTQEPSQFSPTAFALTAEDMVKQLSAGGNVVHINTRDGPHFTSNEPGETEMKPLPHTNYEWSMPAERVVAELEDHISQLRSHRAKLSAEAQVLWWWLAEKEAQYYRIRDRDTAVGYEAEQAKKQLHYYVQTLAGEHLALWMAVGKLDWMIADSQKRISQHQQSADAFFQSLNEPTPPTEAHTLGFPLERLQSRRHALEDIIKGYTSNLAILAEDMKDPQLPNVRREVRDQVKKLSKRDREKFWRDVMDSEKETRQEAMVEVAAVDEILRDAERRVLQMSKKE